MKIKSVEELVKLGAKISDDEMKNYKNLHNQYGDSFLLTKLAIMDDEIERYNKIIDENIKSLEFHKSLLHDLQYEIVKTQKPLDSNEIENSKNMVGKILAKNECYIDLLNNATVEYIKICKVINILVNK